MSEICEHLRAISEIRTAKQRVCEECADISGRLAAS